MVRRVLILGGTSEALGLARGLSVLPELAVTMSLAGRTRRPRLAPGRVRFGGFGGADGLARYLALRQVDLLVDASHPFATRITLNAAAAAASADVPLLVLRRPVRRSPPGAIEAADALSALRTAARFNGRILVTFQVDPAWDLPGDLVVRAIEPPARPPAPGLRWRLGRGPFSLEDERTLLQRLGIEVVVAKASGGATTAGKAAAARDLGIPLVLVVRPPAPDHGPVVEGVAEAVRWIEAQVLGRST